MVKRNWLALPVALWPLLAGCGHHEEATRAPLAQPADVTATPAPREPIETTEGETMKPQVMRSRLAGTWYPADPDRLRTMIDTLFADLSTGEMAPVRALILPHAGYQYSGRVAAAGLSRVQGHTYRRVVILGPTHHVHMQNRISVPDVTHLETPLGTVPLDTDFIDALLADHTFRHVAAAHTGEHSVQIEVPLLQVALKGFALVPLVVGQLDAATARHAGTVLRGLIDADTLVVASTDFTHFGPNFGYLPFQGDVEANIRTLDMDAFAQIEARDVEGFLGYCERTGATICGRNAVAVLLAMLDADANVSRISYDTSGHITGDFENSVSYLSAVVDGAWNGRQANTAPTPALSAAARRALLHLARRTIELRLATRRAPTIEATGVRVPEEARAPGAAFVTLTGADDQLRGCIGELVANGPLVESIMENAQRAALSDPRFPPVDADELAGLHLEISALTPPRPVSGYDAIELGRHGIILSKGLRRAVFLPQVAGEQGWDLPTTLTHLSRKAGLGPDDWREGASLQVFEATVFGEDDE
jgi:AmmeMemoRadiSam system protein B/AmmeMemoRadiSam system protein A